MAKKQPTPKRKTAKPRREFVVGYRDALDFVYGPDCDGRAMFCDRMSMYTARRRITKLMSPESDACIYRLVPVAVGRVVNGKFVERKPSPKAKPKAVADEPMVTGPHGDMKWWDIRTQTHWFGPDSGKWIERDSFTDGAGMYTTQSAAKKALPAARKAWAEMKKGGAK